LIFYNFGLSIEKRKAAAQKAAETKRRMKLQKN